MRMTFVFAFLQHLKTNNRKNTIFSSDKSGAATIGKTTLSIKTLVITTLSILILYTTTCSITLKLQGPQHNNENDTFYYAE